jgi:myosin-crossreactive antigen
MEKVDESTRVRKEMHDPSPLLETPKKSDLRGELMKLEENPLGMSTDDFDRAKSNAVQIHYNRLESHYERNTGNRSDVTPKTGQFMSMVSDMIDVSKDGAVATNLHAPLCWYCR